MYFGEINSAEAKQAVIRQMLKPDERIVSTNATVIIGANDKISWVDNDDLPLQIAID